MYMCVHAASIIINEETDQEKTSSRTNSSRAKTIYITMFKTLTWQELSR